MIKDPRDPRGKKYPLDYLLTLIIIGFMWGKNDFVNIEQRLIKKKKDLAKIMDLSYGIPSHDTMTRIMRMIPENEILYAAMEWMAAVVKSKEGHIAIDGKGIRAAAEKVCEQRTPYILNVLDTEYKFVIGQLKIYEKTNEITGIMSILDIVDIVNQTVTIDAIGTQADIVEKILKEGGHYVLPVKKNQGNTEDNITKYMCDIIKDKEKVQQQPDRVSEYEEELYYYSDYEKSHGRIEKREYYLSHKVKCVKGTKLKGVKAVGYVKCSVKEPIRDEKGKIVSYKESDDEIAYIMDKELGVKAFAEFVRDHWRIENSLHWVLDNTYREDRSTIRKGNALENTSLIRKVSYDIARIYQMRNAGSFECIRDDFRDDMQITKSYIMDGIESLY